MVHGSWKQKFFCSKTLYISVTLYVAMIQMTLCRLSVIVQVTCHGFVIESLQICN